MNSDQPEPGRTATGKPEEIPAEIPEKKPAAASAEAPAAPPRFPVVGIGASAGGLAAFEAFFAGMPPGADPGMAFVLVQHLAPDHKSMLTELIGRCTRMQVFEVEDGMVVRPGCAYIIPPGHDMALLNGALHLLEPAAPRGQRLPIDFFFRSLAQDLRERAIGIVLSGTGSDGTLGVRAIKGEGGMVMAQTPASTEFDGMPKSAIATGMVDYELAPADMAGPLIAYAAHTSSGTLRPALLAPPRVETTLKKIFVLLRSQTGHDFSLYKPNTIHRRIERRMAVHQIKTINSYLVYLQQTPAEVDALFHDLLIGVTNFFRDPDAFGQLETLVVPKLFEQRPESATLRVWVPGCSTGEEAYSIAILLQERMDATNRRNLVQVFATDIDSRAISTARAGLYPASIAADVTEERLARFFTSEADGSTYRVRKGIRDMLVFSEHDITRDPPFSTLDLVSCRNLLIYMGSDLQKRLIPLFHYALAPGGHLFLGTSESIGDFLELFNTLDRKAKLYQRKEDPHGNTRTALVRIIPGMKPAAPALPAAPGRPPASQKPTLRERTEQALLQNLATTGVLVGATGDVLYIHGRSGLYLEPAAGEAGINNILTMAREGLRRDLALLLHKARNEKTAQHAGGLRVRTNGHHSLVELTVSPLPNAPADALEAPLFLVMLTATPLNEPVAPAGAEPAADAGPPLAGADAAAIAALREAMRVKEEYLKSAGEELEASNEELKSANEEMQSVNEELQSTNEELETSKEEMQSLNEELGTVNNELQAKVADLTRVNNDMNNLLAGTGIATVFVDLGLRILRFTPSATRVINLIPADVGRPVAHIVSNLVGYGELIADLHEVLETLVPKAVEVNTADGACYSMRLLPYRTLDNVIEGAVISFLDITEMRRLRDALQQANDLARLSVVVRDASDAITMLGQDGAILAWNPAAVAHYGWSEAEALTMKLQALVPSGMEDDVLAKLQGLARGEALAPHRSYRQTKGGAVVSVWVTATALLDATGRMYAVATTERADRRSSAPAVPAADPPVGGGTP